MAACHPRDVEALASFFPLESGWPVYYVMAVTRGKSCTLCDLRAVAQAAVLLDGRLETCSDVRAVGVCAFVSRHRRSRGSARNFFPRSSQFSARYVGKSDSESVLVCMEVMWDEGSDFESLL